MLSADPFQQGMLNADPFQQGMLSADPFQQCIRFNTHFWRSYSLKKFLVYAMFQSNLQYIIKSQKALMYIYRNKSAVKMNRRKEITRVKISDMSTVIKYKTKQSRKHFNKNLSVKLNIKPNTEKERGKIFIVFFNHLHH